jgi:hypothetical protein
MSRNASHLHHRLTQAKFQPRSFDDFELTLSAHVVMVPRKSDPRKSNVKNAW